MILFASISSFRRCLDSLLKVKRGVCWCHCRNLLRLPNVPIGQIRTNRDMILADNDSVIIKLRLPDKKQKLSKSEGYRLIYLVMKHTELVVFLTIYPKRGPLQQININNNHLVELLQEFVDEFQHDTLVFHDIQHDLETES